MDERKCRKYDVAYFREISYLDQCELQFYINSKELGIDIGQEEINAVRQSSDNVSSLLQHIKNKLVKLMQKQITARKTNIEENIESDVTNDIIISLKQNNEIVDGDLILQSLPNTLDENVFLQICEHKYHIIFNAPLVKQLKLPQILYADFSIQPSKFNALFADRSLSIFYWYKSMDKITWKKVGEGFIYFTDQDDVDHYIKLVCIPLNARQIQGPIVEVVSENKVEIIQDLPACPFEKRHNHTTVKLKGLEFRVVSYNILADRYTTDSENYSYCPPKVLAIDYRKQLILKELLGYNADIICLQEVDNKHFTTYFKEKFKQIGYGAVYHRKGNRIPEGLACIYNKSRLKQVASEHIVLSLDIETNRNFSYLWKVIRKHKDVETSFLMQSTSLQVTVLKFKEINRHLIVGNTHLYYHPDADHIRLLQVNMVTSYLQTLKLQYLKRGGDVAVIICGDFNSCPEKSLFSYMTQGGINPDHEDCLRINANSKVLLYHEFIFESACGTPKYTNYTPDYKGCLDYIFIERKKMEVQQIVPLPEEEELRKHEGLPNDVFPSDHLALVVDLKFKGN